MDLLKIALESNKEKIYQGKHNVTYAFFYQNKKYTLREKNQNQENNNNEIVFSKSNNQIIYINKKYMVKEFIKGAPLKKPKIKHLIKIKKELDDNFFSKAKMHLSSFDYQENEINDTKYKKLVKKYTEDKANWKICHGDLRKKNIINEKNNSNIHLIDFEWVRKNDIYFDIVHLYLYCGFNFKQLNKVFNLDQNKFKDFVYIVKTFNAFFETNYYQA